MRGRPIDPSIQVNTAGTETANFSTFSSRDNCDLGVVAFAPATRKNNARNVLACDTRADSARRRRAGYSAVSYKPQEAQEKQRRRRGQRRGRYLRRLAERPQSRRQESLQRVSPAEGSYTTRFMDCRAFRADLVTFSFVAMSRQNPNSRRAPAAASTT